MIDESITSKTNYTDQELLDLFKKKGDNRWLGVLLERYTLLILGICMKYLKNNNDAKDMAQAVFEKVIQEIPKYDIPYFKSWLYSVAKNQCLMKLRHKEPISNSEEDFLESFETENLSDSELAANENNLAFQTQELKEAITKINKDQSRCIDLFYFQKKSYQDIQEETGFTFQQVKSHIQNGKRNLKIILNKRFLQDEKD